MVWAFGSNHRDAVRQTNSRLLIPIFSSALAEPDALKAPKLQIGNTTGSVLANNSRRRIVDDRRW